MLLENQRVFPRGPLGFTMEGRKGMDSRSTLTKVGGKYAKRLHDAGIADVFMFQFEDICIYIYKYQYSCHWTIPIS